MKTNHQRGFVGTDDRPHPRDRHDSTNGNRGIAKHKRGYKKYLRTRTRFGENQLVQKIVRQSDMCEIPFFPGALAP